MRSRSKKKQKVVVPIITSGLLTIYSQVYLFYYSVGTFNVRLGNFGELIWSSAPAGTFFPLPIESGVLEVITISRSLLDYVLYIFVISTGLVYLFPLIFGIFTLFFIWRLFQINRKDEASKVNF